MSHPQRRMPPPDHKGRHQSPTADRTSSPEDPGWPPPLPEAEIRDLAKGLREEATA
jgi:hypothetical protein